MAFTIAQSISALAVGLSAPLQSKGGTGPYTYAVLAGGPGGTISSTGLYTAPKKTGIDVVESTDAGGFKAQAQMLVGTPLELFCDIIRREMGLIENQVYLWDQKIKVPTDERLYVAVGIQTCKPFANVKKLDANGNSEQCVNFLATLSVDIMSRGPDARDRKEEMVMALKSDYAESQEELNSFFVGTLPTAFANLSELDGSAIPYRFNISVNLQYFVTKTKPVAYYDNFNEVDISVNP